MKRLLRILVAVLAVLIAALALRAASLRTRQVPVSQADLVAVDEGRAADRLARAVQIRTISVDGAPPDHEAFRRLHAHLAQAFPRVTVELRREVVNEDSLLYAWEGAEPALPPVVLTGHLDVAPVDPAAEAGWTHPPFSGEIAGGYVWGRGTLDDKVGVLALLEAAEALLQEGFRPRRTVYLAFGHDEELSGRGGAARLAALLTSRGVRPALVMDEGGYVVRGLVPGYAGPVAFVNTAEKGYLTLALRAEGAGGHSAVASRENVIAAVSRAVVRLRQRPFPARLPGSTAATVDALAPELPFALRLAMGNRWLLGGAIVMLYASTPDTEGLVRTTMAPTVFRAGVKDNVVPASAEALVNVRLLPGDTVEAVRARIRETIDDPAVAVEPVGDAYAAPPEADPGSPGFAAIARAIRQVSPGTVVVPGLMSGTSDARYYGSLTPQVMRFLPIELGPEDVPRIHGRDERIAVENYRRAIQFDAQLIRNLCGPGGPGGSEAGM